MRRKGWGWAVTKAAAAQPSHPLSLFLHVPSRQTPRRLWDELTLYVRESGSEDS